MTDDDLKARISAYHAARERQKAIHAELLAFAVETLGLPQAIAGKTSIPDYIDGYLRGRGAYA